MQSCVCMMLHFFFFLFLSPAMSALLEDVDSFLSLNIKSVQDLNLDKLQKLLDSQKSEQKALDAQVSKVASFF